MALTDKLTAIANAIRAKTGRTATMTLAEMPSEIASIPSGSDPVINPLSITANGTYTAPSGVDGYSPINVNVPQGITPTGNINITDTNVTDVAAFATAQVSSDTLLPENIKKNVNILGIVGTFEGGGGTEITDGIVVKARDAQGHATAIEFYGNNNVYPYQFGSDNTANFTWRWLNSIIFKSAITTIEQSAFRNAPVNITIPSTVTSIGQTAFNGSSIVNAVIPHNCPLGNGCFNNCKSLVSFVDEQPSNNSYNQTTGTLGACTALQTVTLGSVGHPVPSMRNNTFTQCAQAGLTITIYCTSANANTFLANIRNGATNATIIIKASENTTYGGTSYAAGDTMITSTP